jgi:hypothetical protein
MVLTGKRNLPNKSVTTWLILLISGGLVWSIYGYLAGNLGAIAYFRIYVIWPVVYYILIIQIKNINDIKLIFKILIFSFLCISVYTLYFVLDAANLVPHLIDQDNAFEAMDARVGIHSGYIQVTTRHIASLFFMLPLVLGIYIIKPEILKLSKKLPVILVGLGCIVAALSGRRALLIMIPVFPVLILILSYLSNIDDIYKIFKKTLLIYFFILLICFVVFIYFIENTSFDYSALLERLSGTFVDDHNSGRQEQGSAFIKHYLESPIIGYGFGAGINEVVRDPDHPWWYELSYHLLLHNVGTIGILYFSGLYIYLIGKCIYIVRIFGPVAYWVIPIIAGSIGIMLGNATNPYLSSFEFLYAIFILFIPLNVYGVKSAN